MAYRKPSFWVKHVFNPIAMRFGIGGTTTLAVQRRRSGETQRVPVALIEHGGARYLVSVRGESDWVRNIRAAGGDIDLEGRGGVESLRAVEVPVEDRSPVLGAYQAKLGKAVQTHFEALPEPADHPTFRLESR